ncbi:MAG: NAD(P)/FAD-dependent oxidoreductase, partial [Archaeoglobaceae archaeon]
MILIVGAGPAGSLSAMLLGKERDVIIAEEHQTAGFPVQCAGLISDRSFERYKKYCNVKKAVENEIRGALFFSPSGDFFEAMGKAFVVERKIFDEMLLIKASEFAEIFVKSKVKFRGKKALVGNLELEPEYIVGADGVNSEVARTFGFERPSFFSAVQIETRFEAIDENFVEIYLGRNYSEFFAYAIPISDTARIGVIARKNTMVYLKNLLEKHPSVSKRLKGGIIE